MSRMSNSETMIDAQGLSKHFGTERKGHLALQAHGAPVHFRSLKIRELPPTGERDG